MIVNFVILTWTCIITRKLKIVSLSVSVATLTLLIVFYIFLDRYLYEGAVDSSDLIQIKAKPIAYKVDDKLSPQEKEINKINIKILSGKASNDDLAQLLDLEVDYNNLNILHPKLVALRKRNYNNFVFLDNYEYLDINIKSRLDVASVILLDCNHEYFHLLKDNHFVISLWEDKNFYNVLNTICPEAFWVVKENITLKPELIDYIINIFGLSKFEVKASKD